MMNEKTKENGILEEFKTDIKSIFEGFQIVRSFEKNRVWEV